MQFSVLTWNIHGKRHITKTNFAKVVPALESLRTDILCLQEAQEARDRLHKIRALWGFEQVFPSRGYNQNVILSRFPVLAHGDVVFPKLVNTWLENALWADIAVAGTVVRVYNCHFGIVGAGPSSREQQLDFICDHAESHKGPVIVCGDLNTTIPRKGLRRKLVQLFHLQPEQKMNVGGKTFDHDERYAIVKVAERRGFREVTDISQATWRVYPFDWELFSLKLDWFLVRGLDTHDVRMYPYITDHRAITAECVLR